MGANFNIPIIWSPCVALHFRIRDIFTVASSTKRWWKEFRNRMKGTIVAIRFISFPTIPIHLGFNCTFGLNWSGPPFPVLLIYVCVAFWENYPSFIRAITARVILRTLAELVESRKFIVTTSAYFEKTCRGLCNTHPHNLIYGGMETII